MRISLNNITVSQLNMDASEGKQTELSDKVKGKILSIQVDGLLLALEDDSTLHAKVQNPNRFKVGDWVALKVPENQEAMPQKNELLTFEKADVKNILADLNMPLTSENEQSIKVVKQMDLPLTKEMVASVVKFGKMASKIVERLPEIIKDESALTEQDKQLLDSMATKLKLPSFGALKQVDIKQLVLSIMKESDQTIKDQTTEKSLSEKSEPVTRGGNELKLPFEPLEGKSVFDKLLKPIASLVKMNKPITVETLTHANRLFLDVDLMGDKVKVLMEGLPKEFEEVRQLLKGLTPELIKNKENVVNFFKELETSLQVIEEQITEPKVKEAATGLITSLKFMQTSQEDVVYFQVPIQLNNELTQLSVMYKKDETGKKTLTGSDSKILIVLNTHHLNKVQALISVKQKTVYVNFKVEDERAVNLVQANKEILENWLKPFDTVVDVRMDSKPLINELFEENEHHYINVRV